MPLQPSTAHTRSLDRPPSVSIAPVAVGVGAEPALGKNGLPVVNDLDGRGPLVRIHPDDDLIHCLSSLELG